MSADAGRHELHIWDRWLEAQADRIRLHTLYNKVEVGSSSARTDLFFVEVVVLNKQLEIYTRVWSADTAN